MGGDLSIRPYRPADEERLWGVHEAALTAVDAMADPEGVDGGAATDPQAHARESRRLAAEGVYLVGELDGELVAGGALDPGDGETAELTRMRVAPAHWRKGFGQALLEALEAAAADRGLALLYLETLARQTAARALYEANGYAEVDSQTVGEYDVRRYEKRLG